MSDTSQAVVRRLRQDSPTVDAACRQLERQVDPSEAELVVDFAEIFFSKASPDFLRERSIDALAHMALGAFRFLQRSAPDRIDVEVLNPDVDNEGWYAPVTVIRTNISERPFIVDSIREFLNAEELPIEHYIYPVLHVERRQDGSIEEVRPSRQGESRESLVHCEAARVQEPSRLEYLRTEVASRLQDVVRATDDFPPMLDQVDRVVEELDKAKKEVPSRAFEFEEVQAFLRWLRDGAFVFLGYRAYDLTTNPATERRSVVVEPGSGLGILRNEAESRYGEPVAIEDMDPALRQRVVAGPLLIISKTNAESTVHRRARMDYIGVKKLDENGQVVGEHRFMGLFTSRAYAEEAEKIPILREKLHQILDSAGVQEGSHDYKEMNTIFNSMPKEELFLSSAQEIGDDVRTVLTTYHSEEVRVTLREDPLQRGVSVMVILAKEKFSGEVRRKIEEALVRAFDGEVLNYHLSLGEGDQARLHFYIGADRDDLEQVTTGQLERAIQELIRTWRDRVREGLERVRPPDEARRQARRYADAFSAEYQAATSASTAVQDILELEAMRADGRDVSISFSNREASPAAPGVDDVTELKLYLRNQRLVLSDFMPILENAGLRVIAVNPFEIQSEKVESAILYSFAVQDREHSTLDVEERGEELAQAILAVRRADATNDALNGLVVTAGLHWREVDLLRAYATYAFQLGAVPSRVSLPSALNKYPAIARILFDLFLVRFDPEGPDDLEERASEAARLRRSLVRALASVELLSDDRALRRLLRLIEATVRTNYFSAGGRIPSRRSGGAPYISFKFSAHELQAIAKTRLLYEVWVRSSRMEGVHLRGARVARGGIRWSDRVDDFRTEVLGLVKTQLVKNAVIVPAGSKGGFVTLRPPATPEGRAEDAKEQYRTLMRGLLDLTDNLDPGGEVLPPEKVVCWDDPDPYLVVAADKGTARFSDVANAISEEYDFWLGDAFASGGSHGYDHKAVGITARGAWECVRRHFHERGKDIQSEPFTVVGIGDMSGDVFGNGMLLSRQIRLIAAFDHRHVFIDPDPDPASSFAERQRLFDLGRSSWDDYDRSLLSEGGMIVPRGAKEVELTPAARRALGVGDDVETLDGESLIRVVLRAPVELLWNGGIGTYVKASTETHADAGDPSNDAVRVDASELRCDVVGEGGNLGLTQRARIEYALAGGRINTDAIDNSGGVDLSDREVNLKILLNAAVRDGSMTPDERNDLLEALTDDVAALVLEDNRSQSLAVSLDEIRCGESVDDFRELMTALEKAGTLDRTAEALPTLEQLVEREEDGVTLTRPELCVLVAYAKLDLMSELLDSSLPDDPATGSYLLGYFPADALSAVGEERAEGHRLHREIIASQLTNDMVDLMGASFAQRLRRDTGASLAEIARAWLISARLAEHRVLLHRMAGQGEPPDAKTAYRWLLGLSRVLERTTRWILAQLRPEQSSTEWIDSSRLGLDVLRRHFAEIVTGPERDLYRSRVEELEAFGADPDFAARLISLRFLDQLLEILRVARETGSDPLETGRAFYRISDALFVPWLRNAIFEAAGDDRWEQRAAQALAADLTRAHHQVLVTVMEAWDGEGEIGRVVDDLLGTPEREVERYRMLLEEIREEATMTLSGLSVAAREMTVLSESIGR